MKRSEPPCLCILSIPKCLPPPGTPLTFEYGKGNSHPGPPLAFEDINYHLVIENPPHVLRVPLPVHGFNGDNGRRLNWCLAFTESRLLEQADFPPRMMDVMRSYLQIFIAFWQDKEGTLNGLYKEVGGAIARMAPYNRVHYRIDQTSALRELSNAIVAKMPSGKDVFAVEFTLEQKIAAEEILLGVRIPANFTGEWPEDMEARDPRASLHGDGSFGDVGYPLPLTVIVDSFPATSLPCKFTLVV
ncbi:hypothetical protein LXA43DRAFT_1095289 [Ganoderma leucocontextum]|nr:hypothetical protein LXA43DRAFT_1098030 [Ganoderma leucocontextum]KAI1790688.1 hypothetical protein LXA43DRAFT_1095289 [Ganoderma leucocontextum]